MKFRFRCYSHSFYLIKIIYSFSFWDRVKFFLILSYLNYIFCLSYTNAVSKSLSTPLKKFHFKKNQQIKEEKEESDSDEDINEGVVLPEDSIVDEDDDDISSVDDETSINILGESLADQTDSDDEAFEASDDDDEDENEVEKKGVKMFKKIKVKTGQSADSSMESSATEGDACDDDEDEDEDEDDEDDDEESEEEGNIVPGLKMLLESTIEEDEDDEDFDGDESDEDDDDEIESDEEEDDGNQSDLNQSKTSTNASPNKVRLSPEEKAEVHRRTIFIGNVHKDTKESKFGSEIGKFGPIQSLRVRGVVPPSPKTPIKLAAQKRKIHDKIKSICMFIVYKAKKSAVKALSMNGKQIDGHYLRVDRTNQKAEIDPKRVVFFSNVPFDIQDNELWELSGKCGEVDHVRTIRDRFSGACRGIAEPASPGLLHSCL